MRFPKTIAAVTRTRVAFRLEIVFDANLGQCSAAAVQRDFFGTGTDRGRHTNGKYFGGSPPSTLFTWT